MREYIKNFFLLYNKAMDNPIKKAMVMSAGLGTRLEPLTLGIPKPLVTVLNRPVMDILFEHLCKYGIKDVICNTYYLADKIIKRYDNNNLGINFNYIKEKTLSGTAGGLKKCQHFFNEGEDFLVLSADGLTNADIQKGIDAHLKSGAIATIGIKQVSYEDVSHYGVVVIDSSGFITEFQEKPNVELAKSNFVNTGIYIFNYKIFDFIPENTFYDFAKDVFPKLLSLRQINTFEVDEYWNDIGTIESYKTSIQDIFDGKCNFSHYPIIKGTEGNYVCESEISKDVRFVGNSVVGSDCSIGHNVIIEDSIIYDNVKIADNTYISNSIISKGEFINGVISDKIICSVLVK